MIGSPLFGRVTLALGNGKVFSVRAVHHAPGNVYIQSATLNGRPLTAPLIRFDQIMAGGVLEFVMGPTPSRWASNWRPRAAGL